MKIVHVVSGLTKGGGERIVVELANYAATKGDKVTILAGWPVDPGFLQNSILSTVNIQFIASKKSAAYFKILFWIIKRRRWIHSQDILHCHLTYGAVFGSFTKILLKTFFRNPHPIIIETYHAVGMSIPRFNRWMHSCMILHRDGLVLMAKDKYWENYILKHPHLDSRIIPNGIALLESAKDPIIRKELITSIGVSKKNKYLVGTVGMLRSDRKPWLYIPVFIKIFKILGNEVHFILAGGGEEYKKVRDLAEQTGILGNFHMTGLVNEPVRLISNLDVYVSLSVRETGGISMIEAAMCKVPVVAIQLDKKYKPKEEDWVWSDSDIQVVADKIVSLLLDEHERARLVERQYDFVMQNFTSDIMYSSYNKFYNELLSSITC